MLATRCSKTAVTMLPKLNNHTVIGFRIGQILSHTNSTTTGKPASYTTGAMLRRLPLHGVADTKIAELPYTTRSTIGKLSSYTAARYSHSASPAMVYRTFPATVMRLNAGEAYKAYWFEEPSSIEPSYKDDSRPWTDRVLMSRPKLLPNSFTMQTIIRFGSENYDADIEGGLTVEVPYVFTIPKGTPVPTTLVLRKEEQDRDVPAYFLQPSRPTSHQDLDKILCKFYAHHATKQDATEWIKSHPWEDCAKAELDALN